MVWGEFEAAAPRLARDAAERLAEAGLALLGTLRRDGSPRVSPVEPYFLAEHLVFGTMTWSRKALDLARDARCVLHSPVSRPDGGEIEVKLYGRAVRLGDEAVPAEGTWWASQPPGKACIFSLDVETAAIVRWDPARGRMRLARWSPAAGERTLEREYP